MAFDERFVWEGSQLDSTGLPLEWAAFWTRTGPSQKGYPEVRFLDQRMRVLGSTEGALVAVLCSMALGAVAEPVWGAEDRPLLEPVWSLRVHGDRIHLLKNDFAGDQPGAVFPVKEILIRRVDDRSEGELWGFAKLVSVHRVGADGTVDENLRFVRASVVSEGMHEDEVSIMSPDAQLRENEAGRYAEPPVPVEDIVSWAKSPDDKVAVVHSEGTTFFMNLGTSTQIAEYPYTTYGVSFAENAKRFVLAAKRRQGNFGNERKLVVFGFNGRRIRETEFDRYLYGQVYFAPSGDAVMFTRREDRRGEAPGPPSTITMRVGDGAMKIHKDIPFGLRYYSGDGQLMLVAEDGYGTVSYFDVSDALNPKVLWEYDAGEVIASAAVCDDGSIVAVHRLRRDNRSYKEVVILDREMNEVGFAHQTSDEEFWGLHFAGKYLFAGMQKHPLPAYNRWKSTVRIDLFDLNNLGVR